MIKIRLTGTPEEVDAAAPMLATIFRVLEASNPSPNRPPSAFVRQYFDAEIPGFAPAAVEAPASVDPAVPDRQAAALWARQLVDSPAGFVVLDTETTGLNRDRSDEACQIAIVDQDGDVLLDTLIRPTVPIDPGAAAIHGITDAMVASMPTFAEVLPTLQKILVGRQVIIYNFDYDYEILGNAIRAALPDATRASLDSITSYRQGWCAMRQYAAFYGEVGRRGDYRWQKLTAACAQQRIHVDEKAHSALGDCFRTLALVRRMAAAATT